MTRFKDSGSVGKRDLPVYFPEQVLTVMETDHPLHGKVNTNRYEISRPDNQSLIESLSELGMLEPVKGWFIQDKKHVIIVFGTRRVLMLRAANALRLEQNKPPFTVPVQLVTKSTFSRSCMGELLEEWGAENNERTGNDWLTIAQGIAMQVRLGVTEDAILQRWPQIESAAMLRRLIAQNGILSAHPAVQEALANREIPIGKALRLCRLPYEEQEGALHARQLENVPKRRYMTPKDRDMLREMLQALPDFGGVVTAEQIAALKKISSSL